MSLWKARLAALRGWCENLARKGLFLAKWPAALIGHKIKMRKLDLENVPLLWLTPAGLIARDLDYFEGEARRFDKAFIDDLAKSRDEINTRLSKRLLLSFTIFVYLLANFLSISVDIKLPGIELKYIPGVPEGLILFTSMMSVYNMIQINAVYTLESVMKYAINQAFPEELRAIYVAKYFPNEFYGRYMPVNLPHILPTGINSFISIYTAVVFLIIIAASSIVYFTLYAWLVIDLVANPKVPYLSRSIGIYAIVVGIYSIFYFLVTRCWIPYRDYTINNELELLSQVNPQRHSQRLAELYDRQIAEKQRMIDAGYIKREVDPSA